MIPLYFGGYDFAHRLLSGAVAGTGAAEAVVRFTGRSRKVGVFLLLASVVWLAGVFLLVPYPGELFESVRFRHYFDDDEEPAWFYLVFAGIFGGLVGAGSSLFWNGDISTPEEAWEQRRYEVGQELKTLLVVVGAIVGILGFFFTLHVLGAYVIAPVSRYLL